MKDTPIAPERAAPWLVLAAFAAVYVIWGSTYLAIRFSLETMPPFGMAAVRFVIAGGLLYAWSRWRGAPRPRAVEWRSAAITGGLLLVGGNGLVVWAELTVPSGIAALVVATVPLFMVGLDWLLGTRPPLAVGVGLVLGFLGVAILIGPTELGVGAGSSMPFDLAGVVALLVASLLWSIGSLYSKRAPLPAKPLLGIAMQMLCGGGLLTLVSVARAERLELGVVSLRSAGALAYLIFFGAIIGFSAYVWLLRVAPTAKVVTYAFVNPVVAVGLGWWLAAEELSPRTLVAATVIVVSVFLITTAGSRPELMPEEAGGEQTAAEKRECCGAVLEDSACRA